jgi:hypothetical protein
VLFADVDNDGDDDLYVYADHADLNLSHQEDAGLAEPVPGDANHLFRNDGDGRFVDITEGSGLADLNAEGEAYRTISAAFADYDLDGCVDLYAAHWRMGTGPDPEWDPDRLYRGDCDGGFVDVSEAAGVGDVARKGFAVLFADLTADGWPDIYVANTGWLRSESRYPVEDFKFGSPPTRDLFYVNAGDGTFDERSVAAGVGADALAAMGIALADFDHDGDFDLYITDFAFPVGYGNAYYRSRVADEGLVAFSEEAFRHGSRPLTAGFGWGVSAADFNNDGHDDLFIAGEEQRWLFAGDGRGEFDAVSSPLPESGERARGFIDDTGIPEILAPRGTAVADYDHDGDVDVVVWQEADRVLLLRNDSPNDHHWLRVALSGSSANGTAIGALVVVHADGDAGPLVQRRQVVSGTSQQSQSEATLHFGLGARARVTRVEVTWPGGGDQVVLEPDVDSLLRIEQDE